MEQREPQQTITAAAAAPAEQPPFRYDARLANEIEARWQRHWAEHGTFDSPNPAGPLAGRFAAMAGRPKFYVLDMFPYPSGAGLHVGHPLGYIGTDVYARYLRMTGHHVLHTFGYDAFGLPAEQYAIETGQHPQVTTQENIANMRRQLRRLGLGHDTRREIATTDVSYYRWTQWIFLQLFSSWVDERTGEARPIADLIAEFETGRRTAPDGRAWQDLTDVERHEVLAGRLAYLATETVNWCPGLGTVLANEEVTADGRSDIGNYPVYRRPLKQWMLRITAFADRLVTDLDLVDWPESIKQMQRNWIGASDGGTIEFPVTGRPDLRVEVFTTRPDTVCGATYLVLAPEHPLVPDLAAADWPEGTPAAWRYPGSADGAADWTPARAVAAYQEAAGRLSDRQRTEAYDKTGVFTGAYVDNPATGERLPVFLADYVLTGYGTGAIMAVPAHDQRDLDFAREFGLPVRSVLAPPPDWLASHGIDAATPPGLWPEAFSGDGDYLAGPGPQLTGLAKPDAIAATVAWLEAHGTGHGARSHRLRDWLFSRQRYWGEPFPIVYDARGLAFALPEAALPVRLPDLADIKPEPAGAVERDGEAGREPVPPLARAHDWASVELDLGDGPQHYRRELNTMPQWAGSCWYYLRYLDPANERAFVDPEVERYWMRPPEGGPDGAGGVDLYVGGVEHAVLHLLYARFWHKVLYDLGHVSSAEPFRRLVNQGYILADAFTDERGMYVPGRRRHRGGRRCPELPGQPVTRRAGKMGKSLKNGVSPDDIYASYGADTLRLYEMAMGPLGADRPWRTGDIVGVYRFLQRLWRSMIDEETGAVRVSDEVPDSGTLRLLHRTIMVVRRDFEQLRYNTAIARLMELTSHAAKTAAADQALSRAVAEPLVLMVAPLAPHIAEELWQRLGHTESLTYAPFPEADAELAAERLHDIPVQINGKTRFTVTVPADADEDEIHTIVTGHADYGRHTAHTTVRRLVIVRQRIVNIVTAN